jgi:hypothetical protein
MTHRARPRKGRQNAARPAMTKWPESNIGYENKREALTGEYKGPIFNLFCVYGIDHSFVSKVYNGILHTVYPRPGSGWRRSWRQR